MTGPSTKLVVLLSGSGTTLENIFEHIEQHGLNAHVDLVVSSKAGAYGLERAKKRGVDTAVVESKSFRADKKTDWEAFSDALNKVVLPRKPDLVILAGFMCFYQLPAELLGRVMNIHPALIPAFSGHGMYGDNVHAAVIARGAKFTGCTVHFVTNEYDAGPIILQKVCAVSHKDQLEDVRQKVNNLEKEAFPEAIRLFHDGRLTLHDGIVHIEARD